VARIGPISHWSSLSRVLLHFTMPGTPDLYQGDEAWNFTLVDPDNRRPVNYDARRSSLASVQALAAGSVEEACSQVNAKIWLTHRLLQARRQHTSLFTRGEYRPLIVRGPRARHVIAFERTLDNKSAIVIAPRLLGPIVGASTETDWAGTSVQVDDTIREAQSLLVDRALAIRDGRIDIQAFPLDLLLSV
jgi:(1->4)-alpha-D-glucan 1-alpha-D-glucosylmutase